MKKMDVESRQELTAEINKINNTINNINNKLNALDDEVRYSLDTYFNGNVYILFEKLLIILYLWLKLCIVFRCVEWQYHITIHVE